jgi:hypothetical protein
VPDISVIRLHALARLKVVASNTVEYFDVVVLTCRVRSLDPDQIPLKNVNTKFVSQHQFSCILVGCKGVPPLCSSLLRDLNVSPINCHGAVISHVVGAQPALKDGMAILTGGA